MLPAADSKRHLPPGKAAPCHLPLGMRHGDVAGLCVTVGMWRWKSKALVPGAACGFSGLVLPLSDLPQEDMPYQAWRWWWSLCAFPLLPGCLGKRPAPAQGGKPWSQVLERSVSTLCLCRQP